MHQLQDQGTAGFEAVQAFRARVRWTYSMGIVGVIADMTVYSGDKKTKGAALVFWMGFGTKDFFSSFLRVGVGVAAMEMYASSHGRNIKYPSMMYPSMMYQST